MPAEETRILSTLQRYPRYTGFTPGLSLAGYGYMTIAFCLASISHLPGGALFR